ncbi:MAG: biopolymer transporter TolR [Mariniphaga sp.]
MKQLILLSCCFLLMMLLSFTETGAQNIGAFTQTTDVGNPKLKGSTKYDVAAQVYTLTGSGLNIWAKTDEFHFASVKMSGDFILTTFCQFEGKGVVLHRKMGLMIRENLEGGARYADAAVHGDGLTSLQYRPKENNETLEIKAVLTAPDVIQLERKGDTIIMRAAKKGNPFTETGRMIMTFAQPVYAGLFLCSHDASVIETAKFHNFRIDVPAAESVDGYRQPAASRLEIMDIATGIRKVIYTTKDHIEAPNWSVNGKYLIYNSGGLLYKFPLKSKIPEKINTGEVVKCNNDHGLSFDGKMLAISSSAKLPNGKSGSMVYSVPVGGGNPTAITKDVPSYWHGWSPDGKILVYCAERNGDYDVWGIPSKGGDEFQLTKSKGLDDGPEYAPDGKKIYFNSVRSGLMKIWRMSHDGSEQEQASSGPFNDWFAHISPNGKQMVYISYPPDVPANSHPNNKRVLLQIQSTNAQDAKVLAYIYGGQGTMNVPSWSPDGKTIAFVSFTYGDPNY